jgi:UDP-N-acetylglucosamine acyltransferase
MDIHPTAVLDPSLELPDDLTVGPYAILERGVVLGSGTRIGPFCHVYSGSSLGKGVRLEDGVALGNLPQDLKYRGETTGVEVGDGAWLREYVTVNRGTSAAGTTRIGAGCLIMAYAHVAHDCEIGARAIIANGVNMGGHVRVGEGAVVSGMTGIHQFVSIGAGAFIGGNLRVDKDILPFSKAMGEPLRYAGLNAPGLARMGIGPGASARLREFYRRFSEAGKTAALASFASDRDMGTGGDASRLRMILEEFLGGQRRSLLIRPAP